MKKIKEIYSLSKEIKDKFLYTPQQYMLDTIIENPKLASIIISDEVIPLKAAILFGHYLFISDNVDNEFVKEVKDYLFPVEKQKELEGISVFYDNNNPSIVEIFRNNFTKVYEGERSLYLYDMKNYSDIEDDFTRVQLVTKDLLKSNYKDLDMIVEEIMGTATYNNMDDFCDRGIGCTSIIDDEIISFCTSEYPSNGVVAIGIEVKEPYQNNGIATDMTKVFLKKAKEKNIKKVYWNCWKKNLPSSKTAIKCGFSKVNDFKVMFIPFY